MAQLTGRDEGGITLACFTPRISVGQPADSIADERSRALGIGAGGEIHQRIYADPYGLTTWNAAPVAVVRIRLIEAHEFARLTGEPVPPSAIDADTYSRFGLPWFEIYDSDREEVPAAPALSAIKSVDALSAESSAAPPAQAAAKPQNVRPIPPRSREKT